jgi:hypothetical protein
LCQAKKEVRPMKFSWNIGEGRREKIDPLLVAKCGKAQYQSAGFELGSLQYGEV